MSTVVTPTLQAEAETRDPWLPMIVIAMGQALMSFNVAAIPVSMSGMVEHFRTQPTTVGTAIVMYSLAVSGFVMLGAKLGQRFGARTVFQVSVGVFLLAMILMISTSQVGIMLAAQGIAGLAASALVPTLVALIAHHFRGRQQAEAVGWLGSARAIAGVLAFVIVGYVASIDWRLAFALLILHAAAILALSFRLKPTVGDPTVRIDGGGVVLAALGVILVSFGFNNLRGWGLFLARPSAPFDLFGVSPAPAMILVGIMGLMAFFVWSHRRVAAGRTPLLALQVVNSPREWATVIALFLIVGTEASINFAVPLYIQIVQGRSSAATSVAMMPFMLTVFFTAILVVRLYRRFTPRQIAFGAFVLVFLGTLWLAFVASNDWAVPAVIAGLVTVGIGQGALVTLLFNVLVTAAPKELAGDVGSLRGVTQNLAAAVGTAVMGTLLVGVLSVGVLRYVSDNPVITAELRAQVDLDNINFVSTENLRARFETLNATPDEIDEAVRINAENRLRALRIGFLFLSGIALFAMVPCAWLPNYRPGEIPDPDDEAQEHDRPQR
ncbi:MAG TPA: MFS transporter [Phycisphaerales bacterium]|nr:MFS transporter [Phycisphaerales bacterium]HMP37235.1 MFS transporter [Phycisphaerales bacterium]